MIKKVIVGFLVVCAFIYVFSIVIIFSRDWFYDYACKNPNISVDTQITTTKEDVTAVPSLKIGEKIFLSFHNRLQCEKKLQEKYFVLSILK